MRALRFSLYWEHHVATQQPAWRMPAPHATCSGNTQLASLGVESLAQSDLPRSKYYEAPMGTLHSQLQCVWKLETLR